MKTVFICDRISVDTEMPEGVENIQSSNSKLQGNPKLQTPISHNSVAGIRVLSGRLLWAIGILVCLLAAGVLFRGILPAWLFMWVIALALYLGCKWITWRQAPMGWRRSLSYFFLWPGMDPEPFISPALPRAANAGGWTRAARNTTAGAALVFSAVCLSNGNQRLWVGWLGMVGIVLFLHFGVFELLAMAWNKAGVRVKPVMQAPIRATSVGEFWGRRWNTAFNDLAYALVFRPLMRAFDEEASGASEGRTKGSVVPSGLWVPRRLPNVKTLGYSQLSLRDKNREDLTAGTASKHRRAGAAAATLVVFAISGLVHELVISLPARGGYGLPTGYFILQGLGVLFERSRTGQRVGLGHGLRGWLFTLACTAGPAFWLFHATFVRNVILPMLQAFGGK